MDCGGLLASHLRIVKGNNRVLKSQPVINADGENHADISHNSIMLQSISVSINSILAECTDCLLQCPALCVGGELVLTVSVRGVRCEDSVKCSSRKLGPAGSSGVGMTHGQY